VRAKRDALSQIIAENPDPASHYVSVMHSANDAFHDRAMPDK